MLRSFYTLIAVVLLSSCVSNTNNIKQRYYEINTTNGIDRKEAKATALYYAYLDKALTTTSTEKITSTITDNGSSWKVKVINMDERNKPAVSYLVDKKTGNAVPLVGGYAPPADFARGLDDDSRNKSRNKSTEVEINRFRRDVLPVPTRTEEKQPVIASTKPAQDTFNENSRERINIDQNELVSILSSNNRITKSKLSRQPRKSSVDSSKQTTTHELNEAPKRNTTKTFVDAFPGNKSQAIIPDRRTRQDPNRVMLPTRAKLPTAQTPVNESRQIRPTETTNNALTSAALTSAALTSAALTSPTKNTSNITKRPSRTSVDLRSSTSTGRDHPMYQLKLLTGGFEKDFNNHIKLKPDHDIDMAEDESINSEIAREALDRNVDTPRAVIATTETTAGINKNIISRENPIPEFNNETLLNDISTDTIVPGNTQLASITKPDRFNEPIIDVDSKTMTFSGASAKNKAILKLMDDLVADGFRTSVEPIFINGAPIDPIARYLEIPPGNYKITTRCTAAVDGTKDGNRYEFENVLEVSMINAHEYILEAQTYRFDDTVECASGIHDIRDTR